MSANSSYSVAIPGNVDVTGLAHLIRADQQEDLVLRDAWFPSRGLHRQTALLHSLIPPRPG